MEFSKCPYSKKCSGCQLQNLSYEEQLSYKQNRSKKYLSQFGDIEQIVGMSSPLGYRNKAQAAFGYDKRKKALYSGIYQSTTGRICPVDSCMIEDKASDEIILTTKKLLTSFKLGAYDEQTGKGFVRHVLVRRGFFTNQIMVVIVSGTKEFAKKRSFVNALVSRHPQITTVVHNVNDTDTRLFLGDYSEVLYGDGYIEDTLCGFRFRISPASFYQINPVQTELLYQKAIELADISKNDVVFDSYCGTGTIGICASKRAKCVIGVELNKSAVEDARENARLNGIENIRFFEGDAGKFLQIYQSQGKNIDVLLMDPPRAGSDKRFLSSVLKIEPQKIVYISCNQETLSRDLKMLSRKYTIDKIQPFDMFPFTKHIETVVRLTKKD